MTFTTRNGAVKSVKIALLGLHMHAGVANKPTKTEAQFFSSRYTI